MTSTLQIELPDVHSDHRKLTAQYVHWHHILCEPVSMQRDLQTGGISMGAQQIKAKILALLNDSDRSIVFKAELDSGLAVVLKFAADEDTFPDDLSQEAAAYAGFLESLQGSVVPTYYGKYNGKCSHGRELSCIVLEDCGEKVECKLRDLGTEEKHKVLEQLGKLHSGANRHLVDFANHNVVVKNGEYRLIGFHDDDLWDHECTFDGEWHFGEEFVGDDRTCYALADVGDSLKIWKEEILPCISINGNNYPCVWYPSQEVIDTLFKEDVRLLQCGDLEFARQWLRGVRKHQDSEELDSDDEEDLEEILGYARKTMPELPEWALDVYHLYQRLGSQPT